MPDDKASKEAAAEKAATDNAAAEKAAAKIEPLVFDTWLGEQNDEVKALLDANTSGLKSALSSERESRKDLEGDLRDLAEKAEGDQKKALEGMADDIESANQKTDFYEDAHTAGVSNLKLAYLTAVSDEMFDRKGNVDFEKMKTGYPELFGGKPSSPKGAAGAGHTNNNAPAFDMNDAIRQKAGRL